MSGKKVEVTGLEVTYNGPRPVTALAGITLSLEQGETCAIIGPSGCGKTTFLYVLAGLIRPSRGMVRIGGEPPRPGWMGTALILQDYGLLPWKTVQANAELGLEIRGTRREARSRIIEPILREMGLWEYRCSFPTQLSGGQKQRVAIARALALDTDLLLMDEPFSSLDALTREELQKTLLKVWKRNGTTMILVTHNIEEAVFLGQKIYVLTTGPGRIKHVVDNPEAGSPDYRKTTDFYRQCTRVRGLLDEVFEVVG